MSFFDSLPPQARAKYIELGRQFGCQDAISQAEATLDAFDRYADLVVKHGFIAEDAETLRRAREELSSHATASGAPENSPVAQKKTWHSYVDAIRHGKDVRMQARSILHIIAQRLGYSSDPVDVEASRIVLHALQDTESSRGDPQRLADQLELLAATLSIPRVQPMAGQRGSDEVVEDLNRTATRLRNVAAARDPDVAPPSNHRTEKADLLCGLIVELVRDARRAARSATRSSLSPEIASAFELVRLYGSRQREH